MCATDLLDIARPVEKTSDPREFIRLLMENERRIYAYILTLLANSADAEDALQETSIILWDKFDEFSPSDATTNLNSDSAPPPTSEFLAWALKVAYFTAQNFRRKNKRSRVTFSNSLFDSVAEKTPAMIPELDDRHEALADCIQKLSTADRQLLQLRYQLQSDIETTAEKSGRSIQAVYKPFHDCERHCSNVSTTKYRWGVNRELKTKITAKTTTATITRPHSPNRRRTLSFRDCSKPSARTVSTMSKPLGSKPSSPPTRGRWNSTSNTCG